MMRESDLDDNDPLSVYVKKAPMVGASKDINGMRRENNKTDSISDVRRQRTENTNHSVTDTENDKAAKTEVSKQTD